MKKYEVTMYEKGYENFTNTLTVMVNDNEHPREKAIDLLFEIGWRVIKDYIRIMKIKRVYY